ncbi:MAG TPA: LysR family transcriptional regulator [Candidatus Dormibacteraeota bacterium]|jgi:DNA-binding transcriptional LysR family regulator|nr:LysR family transcriptional regulator [Candidatus Dormibacteraeota bacterium]
MLDHWADLQLRHLLALQAVARGGSFWAAADLLDCSQSTVSQRIASLERIVGERLVERSRGRRPNGLTEAGRRFLHHAEPILARAQAARADFAAFSNGAAGRLRVGTYQSAGARILPALLREYATAWPAVEIGLTETWLDDQLLEEVERGELDLAFAFYPLPPGPFASVSLLEDPYVLLVPADSELAARPPSPRQLQDLPLIGFRHCRVTQHMEEQLRARGVEPGFVFRSDDNATVQAMVAAGRGVAVVPLLTVDRDDPAVRVLRPSLPISPRIVVLAWHQDRYQSPAARAFVEAARRVCAGLQEALWAAVPPEP